MKQNYKSKLFLRLIKGNIAPLRTFFVLACFPFAGSSQVTYSFTNANVTGQYGPSQAQVNLAYANTNLNNAVTINTLGIQEWTVPIGGAYKIEARGAQGAGASGGPGASIAGEFTLTAGQVLKILVGQMGESFSSNRNIGGGGGSYVVDANNAILVIAGGGGAANALYTEPQGTTSINGQAGNYTGATVQGTGGVNGTGGGGASCRGGGGAGWLSTGGVGGCGAPAGNGGVPFLSGGAGGSANATGAVGGFGGGGSSEGTNQAWTYAGGGGGYSGGGGASEGNTTARAGGGGSYNAATSQTNIAGANTGHGRVIITALCNINLTSTSAMGTGPICSGNSVTITTNAISNYSWSTGAVTSSIVLSPTITTSYTLTATSPSNCTASSVITVTVDNTPTVTAMASSSAVCAGKPLTLTGAGATTYTWVNPGVSNAVTFTPMATADYTVTGTNACGTASAAVSVTVNPLPLIGGAANNPTVCNGTQVILTGTGSVNGYTWTGGITDNVAFTPASTGNYTVTGVSAENCTNTAVAGVTVFITPTTPPVASPTAICVGKTSTISSVGATSGYTWTAPNNVLVANTASTVVSPMATTTYTLVRASGACTSTMQLTVVVNPLPTIVLGTPAPSSVICAGSSVSLSAVGAITYTWYPGGFQGGNITLYPNYSPTPIDYTVVASNANCTIAAVSSVSTNPLPNITVNTATSTICAGSVLTLTASGASSYTWQTPNIPAAQQNQTVVTASPLIPTLYNVSGTNSFGCVSSGNQVIVVNAAPNLTAGIVNPGGYICAGGIGTLTAIGNGPTNYTWTGGPALPTYTVNPTSTSVYTVTGTNPSTNCQSVATVTLAVYISTFVVSSPTAVCKGGTATISASGSATSYTWNVNPNNTPSISVSPLATTIYYVTGINGSCSTTQSVNMIVHPIPNVTASVFKNTICRFEAGLLSGNGATSYSWTNGPATSGYTVFPTVTTTYTLVGTNDATGCSKTVNVTQFVSTCIGMTEQNGLDQLLSIYPNPNNGVFTIHSTVALNISIVNELGQTVKTLALKGTENQVNVNDLANGIYFIRAEKDGHTATKKILVNK